MSVPACPAPWTLDVARGFIFPFRVTKQCLRELQRSCCDSVITCTHSEQGIGMLMLVQYRSSPAGPYDELLYALPCEHPTDGFELLATRQIPTIFVSTESSVINGRVNWGVPKCLAKFVWNVKEGYIFSTTSVSVSLYQPIGSKADEANSRATTTLIPPVRIYTLNVPFFVHLGLLRWACPVFMQKQLNADNKATTNSLWHAYKLGGYGWARLCVAAHPGSSSTGSDETVCPSLRTMGGWVGIELKGNLVMPAPKTVDVSDEHMAVEGIAAHRRRVLCGLALLAYLVYNGKGTSSML